MYSYYCYLTPQQALQSFWYTLSSNNRACYMAYMSYLIYSTTFFNNFVAQYLSSVILVMIAITANNGIAQLKNINSIFSKHNKQIIILSIFITSFHLIYFKIYFISTIQNTFYHIFSIVDIRL